MLLVFLVLEQHSLGILPFDRQLFSLVVGTFAASSFTSPSTACTWDRLRRVRAASSVAMSTLSCI